MAFRLRRTLAGLAAFTAVYPSAYAQVFEVPADAYHGSLPMASGTGAQAMCAHSLFGGYPPSLADAQEEIEGRSFVPVFDLWCGTLPYVDFTNATERDSLHEEAPVAQCLPFLDPARSHPAATCAAVPGLPTGTYYENGGMALRIEANLAVRSAGTYTLAFGHDDGFGFYLGSATLLTYPQPTGARVDMYAVHFSQPGLYGFRLDWFDQGGGAVIDWYIATGDHTRETLNARDFHLVPATDLYPSDTLPCTADCAPCPVNAPRCDVANARCVACLDDNDCPGCSSCNQGVCSPMANLPGLDGGPGCVSDGGIRHGDMNDVGAPNPTGPPGCGCAVPQGMPRSGLWAAAIFGVGFQRRRRSVA